MTYEVHGRDATWLRDKELKPADDVIKRVFPKGAYYVETPYGALVYEPDDGDEPDLENRTVINGVAYRSTYTNNYDELVKFYEKERKLILS